MSDEQPGALAAAALAARGVTVYGLNAAGSLPPQPQHQQQRFRPDSVLPLVSSAVEASSEMVLFESVAGRSAMIGFLVALCLEGASTQPTFTPLSPADLAGLAAAALFTVVAAAGVAGAAARPSPAGGGGRGWWWLGARIHESVMSSLTGVRGSGSGVTQLRVDEVVDFVVDRCLTRAVHPVFDPLHDAYDAGSMVVSVMDTLLSGEDRPDLPQ